MTYRKFKLTELETQFGIQNRLIRWLDSSKTTPIELSDLLKKVIDRATLAPLSTQKAVSERVISPIMTEVLALDTDNTRSTYFFNYRIQNWFITQGMRTICLNFPAIDKTYLAAKSNSMPILDTYKGDKLDPLSIGRTFLVLL